VRVFVRIGMARIGRIKRYIIILAILATRIL